MFWQRAAARGYENHSQIDSSPFFSLTWMKKSRKMNKLRMCERCCQLLAQAKGSYKRTLKLPWLGGQAVTLFPGKTFLHRNGKRIKLTSKIQLVVYYQCCVLIGWASEKRRLFGGKKGFKFSFNGKVGLSRYFWPTTVKRPPIKRTLSLVSKLTSFISLYKDPLFSGHLY